MLSTGCNATPHSKLIPCSISDVFQALVLLLIQKTNGFAMVVSNVDNVRLVLNKWARTHLGALPRGPQDALNILLHYYIKWLKIWQNKQIKTDKNQFFSFVPSTTFFLFSVENECSHAFGKPVYMRGILKSGSFKKLYKLIKSWKNLNKKVIGIYIMSIHFSLYVKL